MENLLNDKTKWRLELKKRLSALSSQRRKEGALNLLSLPLPTTGFILSFAPFRDEINITSLNKALAHTHRLLLPKIEGKELKVFRVANLEQQLKPNLWGLHEPISTLCEEISTHQIHAILVPALGFDKKNYRLGYGKGYYDRFLSHCCFCETIGIGFKEQLVESLPVEKTDIALTTLALF